MTEPTLAYVSQDQFLADVEALAVAIEGGDWRPGFLVGIGRGGLVPAVFLSHRLDLPMLSVDHSTQVFGFGDGLLANLAHRVAAGERLLLIDDINDSGGTIRYMRDALGRGSALIRFAALIDNLTSAERIDYRARTVDRAVEKSWFVFPWEALARRETIVAEANDLPERLA